MEHPSFTMAALCAAGGVTGYVIPSLVAGVGIGALYAYGGYLLKNNRRYAIETALGASMILAGAQFPRAINTQKSLPIALSTLAVVAGGYYGKKWYEFRYGV